MTQERHFLTYNVGLMAFILPGEEGWDSGYNLAIPI